MDGTIAESRLTVTQRRRNFGDVQFLAASTGRDADLRRLLRDTPMQGKIKLSLQREPSYFAASRIEGSDHQTIVAIEDGQIVCAGGVWSRQRFINGSSMQIGYLGGLRLAASCRARTSIIRRGYEFFRELHELRSGPGIYLTSIAADNYPARRLLERGLNGMPTYRYLADFVTLLIPRPGIFGRKTQKQLADKGIRFENPTERQLDAISELLIDEGKRYQFAPVWSPQELRRTMQLTGPGTQDFWMACDERG